MTYTTLSPVASTSSFLSSPASNNIRTSPQDDEDEFYFSDASDSSGKSYTSSSASSTTSPQLGDFLFDDEDTAEYFQIALASARLGQNASRYTGYTAADLHFTRPHTKSHKTRKGTSAFFLQGAAFSSLPTLSYEEKQNAHSKPALKELTKVGPSSPLYHENVNAGRQWEQAMMFAGCKQGQDGKWEGPTGKSETVQRLIASVQ